MPGLLQAALLRPLPPVNSSGQRRLHRSSPRQDADAETRTGTARQLSLDSSTFRLESTFGDISRYDDDKQDDDR